MNTSNIIALVLGGIGFVISAIGLIITPIINLKSKQLEKLTERRLALLDKVLKFKWSFAEFTCGKRKSPDMPLFNQIYMEIRMCGYQNEIDIIEDIHISLSPNAFDAVLFNESLDKLTSWMVDATRKELNLKPVENFHKKELGK
jgi:hypothetical protein